METHLLKGTFPFEDAKCDLACQSALSALLEQLGRYATENAQSERTQGIQNGFGRSAQPCLRSVGRSQIQISESKLRPSVAISFPIIF